MANSIATGVAFSDPAISGGTIDNTTIGATTASTAKVTTLNASGTATLAGALAHTGTTLGFYGKVVSAQRTFSSAVHASSAASVSASFGATQLAILQELMNTVTAIGVWATA